MKYIIFSIAAISVVLFSVADMSAKSVQCPAGELGKSCNAACEPAAPGHMTCMAILEGYCNEDQMCVPNRLL